MAKIQSIYQDGRAQFESNAAGMVFLPDRQATWIYAKDKYFNNPYETDLGAVTREFEAFYFGFLEAFDDWYVRLFNKFTGD